MSDQITLTIEAKVLGQRKPLINNWPLILPPAPLSEGAAGARTMTLRELVTLAVTDEVAAFARRQQERSLTRVMSPAEIEQGAAAGKVDMGGHEPRAANLDDAIAAAFQAFEDRLYLVLLDGAPVESLASEITLTDGARLTFVRLVALIGG